MEKLNFYKEWYFKEIDRFDNFVYYLAFSFTFYAGLIGLVGYMFTEYNYESANKFINFFFKISIISFSIFLLIGVVLFTKIFFSNKHIRLSSVDPIFSLNDFYSSEEKKSRKIFNKLSQHQKTLNNYEYILETRLSRKFLLLIKDKNVVNSKNYLLFFKSKIIIGMNLFMLIISIFSFSFNKMYYPKHDSKKVEIIEKKPIKINLDENFEPYIPIYKIKRIE